MISVPFLKEIAQYILGNDKYDLSSLCMVFPHKRARLYMSRYIGELTSKPVWAPRYFTISEIMEKISGLQVADRLALLFELYNSYTRVTGYSDTFDSFHLYGETLLADFDEIDKYLVNADDLFRNLSDLKNLDGRFNYLSDDQLEYIKRFWSTFAINCQTGGQKDFISLWESLAAVYHDFRNSLLNRQLSYEGMAYRLSVEMPELISRAFGEETRFIFIGFNALSTSEDRLFTVLKNAGRADFFWDYDECYGDPVHEAGTFIRKNIRQYPSAFELNHKHFAHPKNKVFFIPVYSNSGQASVLQGVFRMLGITEESQVEKTAIVLADEELLINTLYGIPAFIGDINVSMGYPLSGSAVFSLIDSLYELGKNSWRRTGDKTVWYFTDIMSVMNNPLLRQRYEKHADRLKEYAIEKHLIYLTTEEVLQGITDDYIFCDEIKDNTLSYLLEVITAVIRDLPAGKQAKQSDPVQAELLFNVYTFLTRLNDVLRECAVQPAPDTLFRLIRKMLRTVRIPFSGEPLAGLQVLGILETRTLDFDNVIILSSNEGILPKPSDRPSFIPYNLKAGFGMPTFEHHDAIYAYYFYRLIQRAGNIALIYDASSGGLKTGERSRFLHQLAYDMKLNFEEIQVESTVSPIPVKPVIVNKTGEVTKALSAYLTTNGRALSPSAVNEYLNCPVKFYFHHLAGLKQPEDVGEDVDARLFGNLLHNALRRIYDQFGDKVVTSEKIEKVHADDSLIYKTIDSAFCEEVFGDKDGTGSRKPEGYNLIVRQVLHTYIKQFLKTEINAAPFTIRHLEEKHYVAFPLNVNATEQKVRIGGVIDRVDMKNGAIRILDYKTGDPKSKFRSVEALFQNEKERNDAVFQVLMYSLVYDQMYPGLKIVPGLYFLRQCHLDSFSDSIYMDSTRLESFDRVEEEFRMHLKDALEELFNSDVPFTQTNNHKICGYCAYAGICRR